MNTTTFDRDTLDELRKEYKKALDSGAESFVFHGQELLTAYAKYLIEYLEGKFK